MKKSIFKNFKVKASF